MTRPPTSLTPHQTRAVETDARRVLVTAAAGSGKTEVLARRVMHLLSTEGRGRILAVTFTRRAAEELRARIDATTPKESWRVDADTTHGLALSWLRQYGGAVGVKGDVVAFVDAADRTAVLRRALAPSSLEATDLGDLLAAMDERRNLRTTGPQVVAGVDVDDAIESFTAALTEDGGIDFPGMLERCATLLEIDPWVAEQLQATYRTILVDEAQDLTRAQTEVLRLAAGDAMGVFAVADPRQVLYAYAGASFDHVEQLVGPGAERLGLPHNFRCARSILSAAERLARSIDGHRQTVVEPNVATAVGAISANEAPSPQAQDETVVGWIQELLGNGLPEGAVVPGEDLIVAPEDIAVMGRTNWELHSIAAALDAAEIPNVVLGTATTTLRVPQARVALLELALRVRPNDPAVRRQLRDELHDLGHDAPDGTAGIDEFAPMNHALSLVDGSLDEAIGALAADPAYVELTEEWRSYTKAVRATNRSLRGFVHRVDEVLRGRPLDPGVRVLNIHQAKGLEFRAVVIVGVYEGGIPSWRAQTAEEVDAERRAFYVALTRASRVVWVCWPSFTVTRYGNRRVQRSSRFLGESGLLDTPVTALS